MKYPHLKVEYSWIYDKNVYEWKWNDGKFESHRDEKYYKYAIRYVRKLQERWDKIEKNAFVTLSNVSGLKWKENVIKCYVLPKVIPFSSPLTIPFSEDFDEQVERIIHESLHNLLSQNKEKILENKMRRKFKSEGGGVLNHILIHAVLKLTYLKIFGEAKTEKYIRRYDKLPRLYHRTWEIVEEYGAQKLINDFIKR